MNPEFAKGLRTLLITVLSVLIASLGTLGTWVVYTTQNTAVSVPQVYGKLNQLSDQIEQVRKDGDRRDKEQAKRNEDVDRILSQHNLDISEALREHNAEIDSSIADMKAVLQEHGKDLADLKSFVQDLKDQKQVIIVHHAEAEAPLRATPSPIRSIGSVLSELLGVAPKHHRAGSGRRPGQPKRTR